MHSSMACVMPLYMEIGDRGSRGDHANTTRAVVVQEPKHAPARAVASRVAAAVAQGQARTLGRAVHAAQQTGHGDVGAAGLTVYSNPAIVVQEPKHALVCAVAKRAAAVVAPEAAVQALLAQRSATLHHR